MFKDVQFKLCRELLIPSEQFFSCHDFILPRYLSLYLSQFSFISVSAKVSALLRYTILKMSSLYCHPGSSGTYVYSPCAVSYITIDTYYSQTRSHFRQQIQ